MNAIMEVNRGSVSVGRTFFAKSLKDYNNWPLAMSREIYQNGIDCGSTKISVTITLKEDICTDTHSVLHIVAENNGKPMTKSELFDKLLQLGESSKSGAAIGGFGKAKEILYFSHRNYSIVSGPYALLGSGAEYTWTTHYPDKQGTVSEISVEYAKPTYRSHADNLKQFVENWRFTASHGRYKNCEIWLNGTHIPGQERVCPESVLTEASENFRLSTCQSETSGIVYVRSGGVYMFLRSIAGRKSYYIDLKKPGCEILTANRDGLTYTAQQELDRLIQKLTNNNISSSRACKPVDKWLIGRTFCAEFPEPKRDSKVQTTLSEEVAEQPVEQVAEIVDQEPEVAEDTTPIERNPLSSTHSVYLSSRDSKKIPARFWKAGKVSSSIVSTLSAWADVLKLVHFAMDDRSTFHVGLVFDSDHYAPHLAEYSEKNGCHIFLINPLTPSGTYRYGVVDYPKLIGIAVHEYAHKLHSCHTESFAAHMTHVTSTAFMHMRKFQSVSKKSRSKYEFYFPEEWK